MKLSKSSALLFGVLNGGLHGRRPVKAIKKQALVSRLYPYKLTEQLPALGINTTPISDYNASDNIPKVGLLLDMTLRSTRVDLGIMGDSVIASGSFDNILIESITNREIIYSDLSDSLSSNSSFDAMNINAYEANLISIDTEGEGSINTSGSFDSITITASS